jgi:hypothetical protein
MQIENVKPEFTVVYEYKTVAKGINGGGLKM